MSHYLQINGQRLIDSLYALGEHGALPLGGVSSHAATAAHKASLDIVVARPPGGAAGGGVWPRARDCRR